MELLGYKLAIQIIWLKFVYVIEMNTHTALVKSQDDFILI